MDRSASLVFRSPNDLYKTEKPYELWIDNFGPHPRTNCVFQEQRGIAVQDVRPIRNAFTLGTSGFEFVNHESKTLPRSGSQIKAGGRLAVVPYLNETIDLVAQHTGAEKVICFDWRFRKREAATRRKIHSESAITISSKPEINRFNAIPPASVVHQDESNYGGLLVAQRHLTKDELASLGRWHVHIINVWRPMVPTVEDAPLAFCDRRTVATEDIQVCDKIYGGFIGEGTYLHYNPNHKWYWWPKQSRDVAALFVSWDSEASDELAPAPHVSFVDPLGDVAAAQRESVEVRVLAFSKKE